MDTYTGYEKHILRPSLFEIDLDAIEHNLKEIQRCIGPSVKLFPVLKCNAYGFDIKEVGQVVQESDVYGVAVADLSEAIYLRQNGVTKPILTYSNNLPSAASEVVKHKLMPTVDDLDYAKAYAEASASNSLKIFVKIDTGLYRNGIPPEEALPFCKHLLQFKNLQIEGIFAHPVPTDPKGDQDYMEWQFGRFVKMVRQLESSGIHIPIQMVASSAIVSQYPHMYLTAVDPGKLIYGIYLPKNPNQKLDLKHAFKSLKTRIIRKKIISPGTPFDGKLSFPLESDTTIGIIPLGWGDGFPKAPLNKGEVLVGGKRVRVLGNLSVEHARIDLTEVQKARLGDEVVVIGKQGSQEITPSEVAELCGMGESTLTRTVREHIPRLFYKNEKPYKLKTMLGEYPLQS